MSAGLPGLGLGGLFFIISALLAPFIELARIAAGRRRDVAWRDVWRQFAMAVVMVMAVDLTLRALYAAGELLNIGNPPSIAVVTVIPLVPVAITGCLLAAVLLAAKAVDLATPVLRDLPPLSAALPSRRRVLAAGGIIATVWFALLLVGAADLSTLSGRGDRVAQSATPESPAARPESQAAAPAAEDAKADTGPAGGPVAGGPGGADADDSQGGGAGAQDGTGGGSGGDGAGEPPHSNGTQPPGGGAPPPSSPGPGDPGNGGAAPPAPDTPPATGGPPAPPPAGNTPPPAPPEDPGPPDSAGPPAGGGPPDHAGPPPHSNAPPQAGPG